MTGPADRLASALADRYLLERELGQGGMATVYLAADLKHDRKVAVKVLKPELAAVIGAERFVREIRTIAALQHPHILGLIDSGEAAGTAYYVMPYVEGESLRGRISREKQLPVDEAVRIAREVASALDYAHRRGVIHRDIKPENILLHEGQALVADFGIALVVSTAGGSRMTETGMSLGTPHYMSPEQAMGEREITARSDVYALGCVLYEMLTGDPPFTGATAQAIVARVLTETPRPIAAQRHTVPASVEAATFRALEKLPADRFASAAEFAAALADPGFRTTTSGALPATGAAARRSRGAMAALGGAVVLLASLALWGWLRPAPAPPVRRYALGMAAGQEIRSGVIGVNVAISPDGSRLVYVGADTGQGTQLWLRDRDRLDATPIPGTEGALDPFFSPTGDRIAFSMGMQFELRAVPVAGGPATTLATMGPQAAGGGAWSTDGYIYEDSPGGLSRVPAAGGTPKLAVALDSAAGEIGYAWPAALPDGHGLLFRRRRNTDAADFDVMAVDLRTNARHVLVKGLLARYVAGYLVYLRADGAVLAAPFDQDALRITGPSVTLFDGVGVKALGSADFAISPEGTLTYVRGANGGSEGSIEFVTVDRNSRVAPLTPRLTFTPGLHPTVNLSPDGRAVAFDMLQGATDNVWIRSLTSGALSRLTFDAHGAADGTWSPDGKSVIYIALDDSGTSDIWRRRADGSAAPERLLRIPGMRINYAMMSPDGRWLVYDAFGTTDRTEGIFARRLAGDTTPVPLVMGTAITDLPTLSPDGRWFAYSSMESGQPEVFVRPFPRAGDGRWQVSLSGGVAPRWTRDGRQLYFIDGSDNLVSVRVHPGANFSLDAPTTAIAGPAAENVTIGIAGVRRYDILPDGDVLAMRLAAAASDLRDDPLVVVDNWVEELKMKMRASNAPATEGN
ncbi:MAG TPA: protein kinase [Gemmatimonadales bacterium]|nr:protein kinase [Gemmatimonadales bacterium]